jgi:hypothetical protein
MTMPQPLKSLWKLPQARCALALALKSAAADTDLEVALHGVQHLAISLMEDDTSPGDTKDAIALGTGRMCRNSMPPT